MIASLLAVALAAEPTLELNGAQIEHLSRAALLARRDVVALTVRPPVLGKPLAVRAIPLPKLLKGLGATGDDQLEVTCADGFVASLPATLVLNERTDRARAFLAIEDRAKPWPKIAEGSQRIDPGPFYVVWIAPERSGITSEQWPFQVVAFSMKRTVMEELPQLRPVASEPSNGPARRGLKVFVTSCLPCHRLNGSGKSDIGPDLNVPRGPTEYFSDEVLRAFVRDPQSLHRWPNARMPAFPSDSLSDADLGDLLAYLHERAAHRNP